MVAVLLILLLQAAGSGPEALARQSAEARQALLAGDSAKAVRLYRALAAALPGDPRLRLSLALALEAAGSYGQELAELRIVTRAHPELTPAWLITGLAYLKLGRPGEALGPLRTVLQREPNNRTARVELADALLEHGEFRESLALFRDLADAEPASAQAWAGVGLSASALAKQAFAQLSEPATRDEWRLLSARAAMDAGRYERAFGLLKTIGKPMAGVHTALAEVYRRTGHQVWAIEEEAKEAAAKAPPPDPRYDEILAARAAAETAVTRLSALPDSAALHELLASLYRDQGRRTEAVAELRKAAALSPADSRVMARLSAALATNREYEEAVRILTPLVRANPEVAEWQYILGDALVQQRRMEEAIPHLEAAVRQDPGLLTARASLGRALLEAGKPLAAIPHLLAAVRTDEEALLFQLAQAYRLTGQTALAERTMAQREQFLGRPKPAANTEPEAELPVSAP